MDPMISLGQKNTLAEYMILSDADNCPPMLDKDLMILELVENGPLIWPTVEENDVIKTKKYPELSAVKKIQANCDMKATNIILQGLLANIYSLERECKPYDAFDKFTHIKGESLHTYYLRFTQLINDMHIYKKKMEQFQVLKRSSTRIDSELPLIQETKPLFKMAGLPCNKFRRDKGKIILVLLIRAMLLVQGEILQVDRQELLDATTAKEKAMLAEAQEAGQILDEEQLAFLADLGVPADQAHTIILTMLLSRLRILIQVPNSKTFLNDMDNQSVYALQDFEQTPATVQDTNLQAQPDSMILSVIEQMSKQMINHVNNWEKANKEQKNESLTAELERCKERVKTFEQRLNIDLSSREKMNDSQMDDMIREKLALKEQIDSLEQNLSKQIKENESLFKMFSVFKNESKEKENKYMENEIDLEKKIKELDNIICKVGQSAQTVHMLTKPQAFYDNTHKQALVEVPSELPKVSLVNTSLKKLKFHLTQFDSVVKKRTTPNALQEVVDAELSKSKQAYNDLLKNYSQLEKHCISLEVSMQLKHEVFQNDESCVNHNGVEIQEYFEINDLKARLQDKDTTICKLKDTIRSLSKNTKEENINHVKCELEPINEELENSIAKLLSENERLCNEINHVKQVFKDQFDSIKQTRILHKEQSDSLINKLNLKSMENEDLKAQNQDTACSSLIFKPLPPRLLQNREVHIDYLGNTQEQANILREIVEQAKAKQPLDSELDLACKYATRIQELLVYVQDTCPNAIIPSAKKVTVKPMNNVKKVRFAEPLTSSSNIKQVESSNTSNSNTHVLSSTRVKCSISNCGSNPSGNKRNDRISQTPSRNKKNKVEAQPRKVNKVNRVVKPVCDVDVKHSLSKANSEILCATCNKSMFDGVHDKCLLDLVQNGNKRTKSAKKHIKQNIWKPTGHVFTNVGFKWKPTCIIFTIVGSSKIAKIVESKNANHSEPNQNWGSTTIDIPSSSSLVMIGCPDCTLLGNVIISRVYYIEGLGHNLFSVGQFCDADLEVAFQKNTCFIRNLEGVDLLLGSQDTDLYIIFLNDMLKSSPIYLLSKASKIKSWLWHRRLSHLNFGTLNKLAKDDLARGIPRLKFQKDHLCSAYNGTEFVNQTLREWYENVGITHQTSVARTPQQNGVVERRNLTLVEAA
ncbi:retrovirus-related pol polyprotein from transposon TNT 1-94 [Tanacetum coccineum]